MSRFHFSKMFSQCTGLTFTHYLSRVRIEHSKDLLLNPDLRVSEIAYDVGFESVTHFNRVFAKIVGQSPTDFRCGCRAACNKPNPCHTAQRRTSGPRTGEKVRFIERPNTRMGSEVASRMREAA
jgi:AraC-like DNA-binding protein